MMAMLHGFIARMRITKITAICTICIPLFLVLINEYELWLPIASLRGGKGSYGTIDTLKGHQPLAANGATGISFSGEKVRTYTGPLVFNGVTTMLTRAKVIENENVLCKKWSVVTTIFEVSEAIRRVASLSAESNSQLKDDFWCTVIVADKSTPKDYLHSLLQDLTVDEFKIHFLSVEDQLNWAKGQGALQSDASKFVSNIPWKHFSRKNIGYLYAIKKGAQVIFDFDDDNILKSGYDPLPIHESHHGNADDFLSMSLVGWNLVRPKPTTHTNKHPLVVNPFPLLGANASGTSWPRGFPLEEINTPESIGSISPENPITAIPLSKIGVLLHIADENPDIDAVHRLTKPLPLGFSSSLIGKDYQCFFIKDLNDEGTFPFVPYNAQSSIHTYSAFWALLLPATVPGRVSDIWRAYFSERLFRDLELGIGLIRPPSITQDRNEHNILADMQAEEHLYYRTGVLVKFLDQWTMKSDGPNTSIPEMMEQLWVDLYERGYVEQNDVELAQLWLQALDEVAYIFPMPTRLQSPDDTNGVPGITHVLTNMKESTTGTSHSQNLRGGVLPVKRFGIKPGSGKLLKEIPIESKLPGTETLQCNNACLELSSCDAWHWIGLNNSCNLFQKYDGKNRSLGIQQAEGNDPKSIVGVLQHRARVMLHPMISGNSDIKLSERTLYVLHFHHLIEHSTLEVILNTLFRYLPSFFDVVLVGPQEVNVRFGNNHVTSLVNAFVPKDNESKLGCNSFMSLPIARSQFSGYGGYLLANDDAAIRFWQLAATDKERQIWFGDHPWVTLPLNFDFPSHKQAPVRTFSNRYPYGPYGEWAWWNRDSGSTTLPPPGLARSNFDAALAAVDEICTNANLVALISDEANSKVCISRKNATLAPYINGKADVFYVPGNALGDSLLAILCVLGEHDVMLEAAVPISYHMVVSKQDGLEMPYCDGTDWINNKGQIQRNANDIGINKEFRPHFVPKQKWNLTCPVIHALKFGFKESIEYWDNILNEECVTCSSRNGTSGFL
jgi:hypothetical protein